MIRTVGTIEYQLTYKKVKNLNMRLHADSTIHVSAPKRVPLSEIDRFVASKEQWIMRAKKRLQNQIVIPKNQHSNEECLALFTKISDQIYPMFAAQIGEKPELRVRWMKTRWGVCYPAKHRITLNQQLYEKPLAAIEYIIVHEYMHFLYPNHQKEFHEAMKAAMPDYKIRRNLLK